MTGVGNELTPVSPFPRVLRTYEVGEEEARTQLKGAGTINGDTGYSFLLTAIDGQLNGGGGIDKFRIKIWDEDAIRASGRLKSAFDADAW